MRFLAFLFFLSIIALPLLAQDYDTEPNITDGFHPEQCSEFFPIAMDVGQRQVITICRLNYAVIYDTDCKIPLMTFENLIATEVDGDTPRASSFKTDPSLLPEHASTTSDYYRSGWDRGHMVAAADMKEDTVSMAQTFYLSNIIPQNPNVNRGMWRYLEEYSRSVVVRNGDTATFIITGVILDQEPERIGDGVCVPSHTFKIIMHDERVEPFLISNTQAAPTSQVVNYQTSLNQIMLRSGYRFHLTNQ